MTRIKMCGLSRPADIEMANALMPDYIGFVFAPGSSRCVSPQLAAQLRRGLKSGIRAVGVFVNEREETVADMLERGIVDLAQLHGSEDEGYISRLRRLSGKPLIKAYKIRTKDDILLAGRSGADGVLLDSGAGGGRPFDWDMLAEAVSEGFDRPYFLAGGLTCGNVGEAVRRFHPFAVDVSSGIETDGIKDGRKMADFARRVRSVFAETESED